MEAAAVPAVDVAERAPGAVVAAKDIVRRYGEGDTAVDALRGVSLDVQQGKLTAVMGPSGSGKSTLMHILAALDRPTSGEVWIAGTKLGELSDNEITKLRREHIGFVFQFFNLLPMLTAEENIVLPLTIAGEKPEKAWREELLKTVGLADRREHRPAELSGRPAAARRDRPRADLAADGGLRRRADRQPRLQDRGRDPRAPPRLGRAARPDDRDGHARPVRGRDRRPDPVPRRRPDRPRHAERRGRAR